MKVKTLKFILATIAILIVTFGITPNRYLPMIGWYIFWFQVFLLTINKYVKQLRSIFPDRLVYLLMEAGIVLPSILCIIGMFLLTNYMNYILSIIGLILLSIFSIYDTIRNWNNIEEVLES